MTASVIEVSKVSTFELVLEAERRVHAMVTARREYTDACATNGSEMTERRLQYERALLEMSQAFNAAYQRANDVDTELGTLRRWAMEKGLKP